MDENLSRGYIQLGKSRMSEVKLGNGISQRSPPVDQFNLIYFSLVLAGISFLLSYNSFVIAADYFQARYPGTTVIFDMSVVYITMAFFAVFANNILVETLSLNTRITFGYFVSFLTLNFIVICEIWWELFGVATSYTINLIAVAIVSLGCTIQQSSFYGFTSMLPSRYTQAVMAGESAAGFWVSLDRIGTKFLVEGERNSTTMFFVIQTITIAFCFGLYLIVQKTEFVKFYIALCQEKNKITLEPTEDAGLMDPLDQIGDPTKGQYGVLKIQTSPPGNDSASGSGETNGQYSAFSFCNPVYEPNAPPSSNPLGSVGPTYKVEDVVILRGNHSNRSTKSSQFKRGMRARLEVAKLIFPYMTSIAMGYFVTLCLYPGIVSEIISCEFGSWMPVILMALFNLMDLVGKIIASMDYDWSRSELLYFSGARVILIPLFLLCAIPREKPVLSSESYPFILVMILGITNGVVGSVPMIQAPSRVPQEYRELTGNIMTFSYTTGLVIGSLVAYVLDAFLGAPIQYKQICPDYRNIYPLPTTTSIPNATLSVFTGLANSTLIPSVIDKIASTSPSTIQSTVAAVTTAIATAAITGSVTDATSLINSTLSNYSTMSLPTMTPTTSQRR